MDRLDPDFIKFSVEYRTAWLVSSAHLTRRRRGGWLLTVSRDMVEEHREVLVAAMMLEVIRLDWPGKRFWFRFPLPHDEPRCRAELSRLARDYRIPYRRAMGRLVSDAFLDQMAREDRAIAYVCEAAGIARADLEYRVTVWRDSQARVLTFPRLPAAPQSEAIPF